jgi:hypothetical protein
MAICGVQVGRVKANPCGVNDESRSAIVREQLMVAGRTRRLSSIRFSEGSVLRPRVLVCLRIFHSSYSTRKLLSLWVKHAYVDLTRCRYLVYNFLS